MEYILAELIDEMRMGFQIPFFYDDVAIENDLREGDMFLKTLVDEIDYEKDLVARMLLKNYAFYSYNNCIDDFKENYSSTMLQWQLSKIKVVNDEEIK